MRDSPKDKVFATLWYLKKNAYADSTIEAVGKRLRHLAKYGNLDNPEQIKGFVATKNCGNAYKESLVETYDYYCQANGINWKKPFYQRYDKLPKIPSEEKINMLIANASRKYALILSMMRDLATRPVELTWLRVRDVDLENGVVTITSAKHCVGRSLRLKPSTLAMLKTYISEKKLKLNDKMFPIKSSSISEAYRVFRNRLAGKLKDQTFKTIRLYDFRHFTATMTYHKTKDLLYVKSFLGHKDLRTTLRYVQLIEFPSEEFHSAAAKTVAEARRLIESGFQYVTEIDRVKLFRKRK